MIPVHPDAIEGLRVLRSMADIDWDAATVYDESKMIQLHKWARLWCERNAPLTAEWIDHVPLGEFFAAMRHGVVEDDGAWAPALPHDHLPGKFRTPGRKRTARQV